jgi:hypothetical protein
VSTHRPLPLADTLDVLLPGARDTLLLRACLGEASAWDRWLAQGPGLPATLARRSRLRRLLPLLHHALAGHEAGLDEPTRAVLRAAVAWETRRAERIRQILAEILPRLCRAGAPPVLLKGVALAATVYPRFDLRHCHDIDLLVPPGAMPSAREVLIGAGFRAGRSRHVLQHRDGLPVTLHGGLWAGSSEATLLERAGTIEIDGEAVPILAPMDMLLHACGHPGVGAGPGNWVWIIDAQIARYRAEGLPESSGLIEAPILLRRHTPAVARLNAAWWAELARGSRRDQLSFNYASWKLGFCYATFPLSLAVRNGLFVKFRR